MIAGTGYAASRLLGGKNLGIANEVVAELGLDSGNAPVLLMLGPIQFSLNTAAFSTKTHTTNASWATVPRFGGLDVMQATGLGTDTIELPGVTYPQWRGSAGTLETLRQMILTQQPYTLIGPDGTVLGSYVIQYVRDEESLHQSDGTPRKISFTISLAMYALPHPKSGSSGRNPLGDVWKKLGRYAGISL